MRLLNRIQNVELVRGEKGINGSWVYSEKVLILKRLFGDKKLIEEAAITLRGILVIKEKE